MTSLTLPGQLDVTLNSLTNIGTSLNTTVTVNAAEANRSTTFTALVTPPAFIKVIMDINALITHFPSSTTDGQDDSWSLPQIVRTGAQEGETLVLELPTTQDGGVDVTAGSIQAAVPANAAGTGTFPVTCNFVIDNQGAITTTMTVSGGDVTATFQEDRGKAQLAYWPINDENGNNYGSSAPSAPNPDTGVDTLSATLTSAGLTNHFSTELNTIRDQYNGNNVLDEFTLTVDAISGTNSELSNYARSEGKTDNNVFATDGGAGSSIVTATAFSYAISVVDSTGSSAELVGAQNVVGVLQQKAA